MWSTGWLKRTKKPSLTLFSTALAAGPLSSTFSSSARAADSAVRAPAHANARITKRRRPMTALLHLPGQAHSAIHHAVTLGVGLHHPGFLASAHHASVG